MNANEDKLSVSSSSEVVSEFISSDFILQNGYLIAPSVDKVGDFDVLVKDGKIAAVDTRGAFADLADIPVVNCQDRWITPGLVDIHVHLREPGFEWKEDIESGSRAAVAGGFTTVCCMPNTMPAIDKAEIVTAIKKRARDVGLCNVYPIASITVGRKGTELSPYQELKDAGAVAFSDDGAPVASSLVMRRALEYTKMLGLPLAVHEEDVTLCEGFQMHEGLIALQKGLRGMPGAAEDIMVARDIELARLTGGHVHFCHVSTARSVELIRRAKEDGINVTAETTPHYLTLTEEAVNMYDTNAKMSMPLRTRHDAEALLCGLRTGVIDCIASDHAPHEPDTKNVEFDKASFGIIGLQSTLPIVLELVRSGHLDLKTAINTLSAAPARCFDLVTNRFAVGDPADIVVVDSEREWRYTAEMIQSKSKNSPYLDWPLRGIAERVFFGGKQVVRLDGEGMQVIGW